MSRRHQRPKQPKAEVDIKKRDWIWANGAVVCDKWLNHSPSPPTCANQASHMLTQSLETCSRKECTHEHRDPREGEQIPLCWDYFVNRGKSAMLSDVPAFY
jgi:hypothetical protein